MRRISALCAARPLSLVFDMSAPAALLRLELHPHLDLLQRSQNIETICLPTLFFLYQRKAV
ncbi:lipoprotein signal peptidase [Neisseria sp.]|uniref:lipoprotein signal peptidase n=1 Tax=Neisseria sp. TaxID=192066 RepID=UPI0026DDA4F5|nr:lipoprotein signal peptidase [Neisseria sp.]MDO4907852.1 lipoprotein signal peptidase [Neisseria sp.]